MAKPRRYDVAIIGLGSAGLTAASTAAALGLRTLAIERDRAGGDCLWSGCVPSKTLIASARAAAVVAGCERLGVRVGEVEVDREAIWKRVADVRETIAASDDNLDRYRELGVDIREGPARLVGTRAVEVGGEAYRTRRIVIATGSRPRLPAIEGIVAADPLTTDTIWDLPSPPARLTILGAGPAGVELAQAFNRIGTEVTLIHRHPTVLPRHEGSIAEVIGERLAEEGVELIGGVEIDEIQLVEAGARLMTGTRDGEEWSFEAEELLVCCGREPNVESLDIEGAGIDHAAEGILTDSRSRTSAKRVYAVGDVAGRSFTHTAGHDAAMAIRDLALPGVGRRAAGVPAVVFTDPEFATAGLTFEEAQVRFPRKRIERLERDLASSDRARTDADPPGRVVVVAAGGRIAGIHMLAPGAGEAVGGLQREVVARTRLSAMAGRIEAYPTRAIEIQRAIGDRELERARRLRSWIPRIPGL